MKLLSWGANTYSQLGHGLKCEQCVLPIEISDEDLPFDPASIVTISGGGGHTLVLDKDRRVFGCGWNNKGQLSFPINSEVLTFKEVETLKDVDICELICGWDSSLAVTCSRKLLVWGSNAFGQLGFDKRKVCYSVKPLEVPVPDIKCISSGLRHTALLTEDGKIFVCGNGRKGQLGMTVEYGESKVETVQPCLVPDLHRVRSISCGQHHTVALTETGKLFVWGDNKHGQLGLDPTIRPTVATPVEITIFPKETLSAGCKISCGWTHTVLLTEKGEIFNWGRNTYGQLGSTSYQRPASWAPQKVANIDSVKQMEVGSEHNIALLDSGRVMSWGWNEHGNCGTGTEIDVLNPTLVGIDTMHKAKLVGAGGGHSMAVIH